MEDLHNFGKYNFLGTLIDCLTYEDMYRKVDEWLENKQTRSHHIAVVNAYCVTSAFQDNELQKIYNQADIVGPDGMPFVYWMRLFLNQPCDQFDASSVVTKLAERSKETGYTFYLFGGYPEVTNNMKLKLEELYPHIKIVGSHCPPFRPLTEKENQEIINEINALKPDILCISLGTPKQDYWINENIEKIKGSVMVPCGAIFDFFGGRIKRSPQCISRLGIEWLYRLFSKDFKRLWYRYTVLNVIFLWNFFLQKIGLKRIKTCRMHRPEI